MTDDPDSARRLTPLSRTLLLVDDDVALRRTLSGMFERNGYRTVEAADGLQALRTLEAASWPIGIVLSDVHMPGLDGPGLWAELQRCGRALPFVFMSGEAPDAPPSGVWQQVPVLVKPFTIEQAEAAFRTATRASWPPRYPPT